MILEYDRFRLYCHHQIGTRMKSQTETSSYIPWSKWWEGVGVRYLAANVILKNHCDTYLAKLFLLSRYHIFDKKMVYIYEIPAFI